MNKEIWLWLVLVFCSYNPKLTEIVESYGDVRTAAQAVRDGKCDNLSEEERQRAKEIRSGEVSRIIAACEEHNIRIITIEDDEYPELLKSVFAPPAVLFVQGSLEYLSSQPALTVIGTRGASSYALDAAQKICAELVKLDMVLVSGLAVGVDSAAHQSALRYGGRTIAVLACGNLVDYPADSHDIRHSIIRSGGAVISELPPYTKVSSSYFQYRNRIMAGLSQGTFIVEAPERSGCHLTAEHALQQGRELFCLPPMNVMNPKYTGVVRYLRDGAIPVFSHIDIVNAYQYELFKDM